MSTAAGSSGPRLTPPPVRHLCFWGHLCASFLRHHTPLLIGLLSVSDCAYRALYITLTLIGLTSEFHLFRVEKSYTNEALFATHEALFATQEALFAANEALFSAAHLVNTTQIFLKKIYFPWNIWLMQHRPKKKEKIRKRPFSTVGSCFRGVLKL